MRRCRSAEHALEPGEAARPVTQVQPQDGPPVLGEHLGVAGGLGSDQLTERERPVGYLEVGGGCPP